MPKWLCFLAVCSISCLFCDSEIKYDLVIKNGLVYNGTDESPKILDIGICQDRIVAIGCINEPALRTIDASGLIVTPGLIDIHTHQDWFDFGSHENDVIVEEYNNLYQGVTTVITGLCGLGMADIDQWYANAEKIGLTTNVYHLIPHGELRSKLFGNVAQKLNGSQMALMKEKVAEQMERGAIGLSTGLIYIPGCLADTDELIELCKTIKPYNGVYVSHVRCENGDHIFDAYQEAIKIGREAHVGVEISHMKLMKPFKNASVQELIRLIEEARAEGLDVTADQYPYEASATYLTSFLPPDLKTLGGVRPEFKYTDDLKTAVHNYLLERMPNEVLILDNPNDSSMNGKNIQEIAIEKGVTSEEAYLDIICNYDDVKAAFFCIDENDIRLIMKKDWVFTASDQISTLHVAGSKLTPFHPRTYGSFARKISKFVMGEHLITLNHAIRSMTSLPAEKFHLFGRGEIKVGNYADIAVIDLDNYKDMSTFKHIDQYAQGVTYVVVNGAIELDHGVPTAERGGRLVRRWQNPGSSGPKDVMPSLDRDLYDRVQ